MAANTIQLREFQIIRLTMHVHGRHETCTICDRSSINVRMKHYLQLITNFDICDYKCLPRAYKLIF
jgi:hypothetical protein